MDHYGAVSCEGENKMVPKVVVVELINNKEILRLKRLASCLVEKNNKIPSKRISDI
jgi:hypothetical protein